MTNEPGPTYAVVQLGRTYFESREEMRRVRADFSPETRVLIDGVAAAEIYSEK